MKTLRQKILSLSPDCFIQDHIRIRPIQDDLDLWFAVVECKLHDRQKQYVNPAGFSIGRAYLKPEKNVPCIIWMDNERIGYIVLRKYFDGNANSWSYFLDKAYQGYGYGTAAAKLAVNILKTAEPSVPIKLSAEQDNTKAHKLYCSIGFHRNGETDGDDLVFEL